MRPNRLLASLPIAVGTPFDDSSIPTRHKTEWKLSNAVVMDPVGSDDNCANSRFAHSITINMLGARLVFSVDPRD